MSGRTTPSLSCILTRMAEIPTKRALGTLTLQEVESVLRFTDASCWERTLAGRQQSSLECSSISRYVWLARFWTLYLPCLSFPFANMDIGSSGGETFMVAGNRVIVEPTLEQSPHLCIPATLFSLNSEGYHDDTCKQGAWPTHLKRMHRGKPSRELPVTVEF